MSDSSAAEPESCRRWNVPQLDDLDGVNGQGGKSRDAGYAQGYAEGLAAGTAEIQHSAQQFRRLIDSLVTPFADLDREVEQQLVQLATRMAQQLIRRELATDPSLVLDAVRQAMAALPVSARRVRVHLHPQDAVILRETAETPLSEQCELVEDPLLERGGCRVTTEVSRVDATLQTRIDQVIAAVLGEPGAVV